MKKRLLSVVLLFVFLLSPIVCYSFDDVNEKSTCKITLTFLDEDGNALTPTSGDYTIVDIASGTVIKASTAFSPISNIHAITISNTENALISQNEAYEKHRVTVKFNYGASKAGTGDFIYRVRNLPDVQ